jgi:protein-disulfide isomerase
MRSRRSIDRHGTASHAVNELTSATVPPIGPADHVRGRGSEAVVYLDLACPQCAAAWLRIRDLDLRLCVRHFPLAAKRPRSLALHAAAEAAATQRLDAFWAMVDSIYSDQGRIDDPHLWERARLLDLDLDRFDSDRRSGGVADRVRRDFETGIRAGVTATPTAFVDGRRLDGEIASALAEIAA